MEEEKLKVPVYEGMAYLLEVVNASYFAKLMGVSHTWISKKQSNKVDVRNYKAQYLPTDIELINETLPKLANEIMRKCLIPKEIYHDSDALSFYLRNEVKPILILKRLAEVKLGRNYMWLKTRLDVSKSPNRRTCKFTPQDAEDFNRAIKEIILYIRGVEMVYEPPK